MRPLTPHELEEACTKVLENARQLLSDAETLLAAGRVPRAYSLAILALEEVAKVPMLRRAATSLALGQSVDWKRLGKRLRQHDEKLGLVDFVGFMLGDLPESDEELREAVGKRGRESQLVADTNERKQAGLYVCVTSTGIQSPDEAIDKATTEQLVTGATGFLKMFEDAEKWARPAVAELRSNPEVRRAMLVTLAEDFGRLFQRNR